MDIVRKLGLIDIDFEEMLRSFIQHLKGPDELIAFTASEKQLIEDQIMSRNFRTSLHENHIFQKVYSRDAPLQAFMLFLFLIIILQQLFKYRSSKAFTKKTMIYLI